MVITTCSKYRQPIEVLTAAALCLLIAAAEPRHPSMLRPTEAAARVARLDVQGQALGHTGGAYLPLVLNDSPAGPAVFEVFRDTELRDPAYLFRELRVPRGITVTMATTSTLHVLGATVIDGTLISDCTQLRVVGEGPVTVLGRVDNRCRATMATRKPGDLVVQSLSGPLIIGAAGNDVGTQILSSGAVRLIDGGDWPKWWFDVLPTQRAPTPLAPVCLASADSVHVLGYSDMPAEVRFRAEAADPDGGPIRYAWDFGDGHRSEDQEPTHGYAAPGTYAVHLTAIDDEADACQATLQVVVETEEAPAREALGVRIDAGASVIASGNELEFAANVEAPEEATLSFAWDFGDGTHSTDARTLHRYARAGRYPVKLVVSDESGHIGRAEGAVYAYEQRDGSPEEFRFNVCSADHAGWSRVNALASSGPGKAVIAQSERDLVLGGYAHLLGGDGLAGDPDRADGGEVRIMVSGSLVMCAGLSIKGGDGADGLPVTGDGLASKTTGTGATTDNTAANTADLIVKAEKGGDAKGITIKAAKSPRDKEYEKYRNADGQIKMKGGEGGHGGAAEAVGKAGTSRSPTGTNSPTDGQAAKATGGKGGTGGSVIIGTLGLTSEPAGTTVYSITLGTGGDGGDAKALGGDGGSDSRTNAVARGKAGGDATAPGGDRGNPGALVIAGKTYRLGTKGSDIDKNNRVTLKWGWEGKRGEAQAVGGSGGNARSDTEAIGGAGGTAKAEGWLARATGGKGGDAKAEGVAGSDCTDQGKTATEGGQANATAGNGGKATAASDAREETSEGKYVATGEALGGDGGKATAYGGDAGSCQHCLNHGDAAKRKGGRGGNATAKGGNGGDVLLKGWVRGQTAWGSAKVEPGRGGDAVAGAGNGGSGAECCAPADPNTGGAGGDAGIAEATGGGRRRDTSRPQ